jgi:disulfide bond formation protein DsbB
VVIGAYTILALFGIAINGWSGYRKHRHGDAMPPHDADSPEDRHRFLGLATLLLSGLSFVAVVFAGLVVLFFWRCH